MEEEERGKNPLSFFSLSHFFHSSHSVQCASKKRENTSNLHQNKVLGSPDLTFPKINNNNSTVQWTIHPPPPPKKKKITRIPPVSPKWKEAREGRLPRLLPTRLKSKEERKKKEEAARRKKEKENSFAQVEEEEEEANCD